MRVLPVLLASCALLLVSCGASPSPSAPGNPSADGSTGSVSEAAAPAAPSYELTKEAVATQLQKDASGTTIVFDRRLFVMNLIQNHLDSIDALFDGFDETEDAVDAGGAKLTETDLAVIVAGLTIEAPQFPLCAQFAARRSSLDPDRFAYAPIDTFCKRRAAADAAMGGAASLPASDRE